MAAKPRDRKRSAIHGLNRWDGLVSRAAKMPWDAIIWWVGAAFLLGISIYYLNGSTKAIDIALGDERHYLEKGLDTMRKGLLPASVGPFYPLWYYLFSLVVGGKPVTVFYGSWLTFTVLLPILLYTLLWRLRVRFLAAFLVSVWTLACYVNFLVQPKVTHLAAVITLMTLICASLPSKLINGVAIGAVGSLLVSYVRPQFFVLFLFLAAVCAVLAFLQRRELRGRSLFWFVTCVFTAVFIFVVVGRPAGNDEAGRGIWSFSQYFGMRWVPKTGSHLNPACDWQEIRDINFGPVNTFTEAFRANPTAVLGHIGANLKDLPGAWWKLAGQHLPLFHGSVLGDVEKQTIGWLIALLLALFAWPSFRSLGHRVRDPIVGRTSLLTLLFLGPALLSSVLMYPVPHFMPVVTVLAFALVSFICCGGEWGRVSYLTRVVSVVCVVVVGCAITPLARSVSPQLPRPNFAVIEFIERLKLSQPVQLLESQGGYHVFLGEHFTFVPHHHKDVSFYEYLEDRQINAIVLCRGMMQDHRYSRDPEWQAFLRDVGAHGFAAMEIPNSGRALLIKRELLP